MENSAPIDLYSCAAFQLDRRWFGIGKKGERERERKRKRNIWGEGGGAVRTGKGTTPKPTFRWIDRKAEIAIVYTGGTKAITSLTRVFILIQYYIIQSRSLNNFKDHSTLIISNMQLLQYIILIEDHLSFFLLHWNIWFLLCTYKYYVVFEAINLRTSWIYVIYSFKLDDKRLCKLLVKIFSLFSLVYWIE